MKIDNKIYFRALLLVIGLLITISPNVLSQVPDFEFDSLTTFSSGYDDFLVNQPIQIWFSESMDFFTLNPNTNFESEKGDSLLLRYTTENQFFTIESFYGNFTPLDQITVTLGSDIAGNSGGTLGTTHTLEINIGPVVYPGDTDNNGIVDERDILPLGIFWQNTGPIRPDSTSLVWQRKPTHRWEVVRATYADADGNGIVEALDICGIADNFGKTKIALTSEEYDVLLPFLKQTDKGFATQIYAALVDCSNKGVGKQTLLDALEPIVNQTPETPLPNDFTLYQNYPNPFNPSTTIKFYLPRESHVTLSVYNITGQKINTLIDQSMASGYKEIIWDGQDLNNNNVASGIYFYRLDTGGQTLTKRMLLLK